MFTYFVARFIMDPRDTRGDTEWFDVVSGSKDVFGCAGLMACADVYTKALPLLDIYVYLRRLTLGAIFAKD